MRRKQTVPEKIHIDTDREAAPASSELLIDRVQRSRQDRIFLTRWVGGLLVLLAIANAIPGAVSMYFEQDNLVAAPIPRWIYIQLFIAFLHAIFAVFLLQISDWSSLRSVSFLLLIVATLFGFAGAALLIAGGEGEVARFLELPFSMMQRAKIWCVAMLLIELFGSYVAGIEAMNWKKMESLFRRLSHEASAVTANDRS